MSGKHLTGLKKPFAIFFFSALLLWLIQEVLISNGLIHGKYVFWFWIAVLLVEVAGIVRKSPKAIGDTLSECLWYMSSGYRSRQIMTAILGAGIGFRAFISQGFINWTGNPELGFPYKYDILNYGGIIIWGIGFCAWIIPHFLHSGERG